ncbi:MAG: hypothetical protein RXR06_10830 [Thermoproteus sp.]
MSYTLDLTQLVNQLGLAQPTPTQTSSPTPSATVQQCSTGSSCIDVGLCQRAGGTCVASCQYGCCCYMQAQAAPTPTQTAPILAPSPTQTPTQTLSLAPTQTQTQQTSSYTIDLTPLAQLLQQSQTTAQTAPTQTSTQTSQPGGPTIYVGGGLGGAPTSPYQTVPTQTPITQTLPPTMQVPQTQPTYTPVQTPTQSSDIAGLVQQMMPLILLLVIVQLVK